MIPTRSRLDLAAELAELPEVDHLIIEQPAANAYDRACDIAAEALAECQRYEAVLAEVHRLAQHTEDRHTWDDDGRTIGAILEALAELPKDPER